MNQNDDVFVHIMNINLFFVQIHNIIDFSMTLSRRIRLKFVIEFNQQKCYQITIDDASKTACDWMFKRIIQNSWKTKIIKTIVVVTIVFAIIIVEYIESTSISINFDYIESISINIEITIVFESFNIAIDLFIDIFQINSVMKHICFNKITVYNFSKTINSLAILIDEYQNLFIDKSITMNISKKNECLLISKLTLKLNQSKYIR